MVNSIYYENMPSFCIMNDRYVMRIVRAMRVQTCAFSRAVLMAGTIAAVQRLSAENHLGLSDGTILIVLSRNVATCTIELGCTINAPPRRGESSTRLQHVPQGDFQSLSTSTAPTFVPRVSNTLHGHYREAARALL